jgi:hypothetical protein
MEVICWRLKGILTKTFVTCIGCGGYFTFSTSLFRWCPSLGAFIPLFPPWAPSFLSKFSLKVSMRICLCYKGPCPPCASFNLLKNHFYFVSFSSFKFVLTMFRFFDGILDKSRWIFTMFKSTFIHSIHLLAKGPPCMVFEHFWDLFDLDDPFSNF